MTQDIPLRMYASDVCALALWSKGKLYKLRKDGKFPNPIDRGREDIYLGSEVYKALGLTKELREDPEFDPIMAATEKIKIGR